MMQCEERIRHHHRAAGRARERRHRGRIHPRALIQRRRRGLGERAAHRRISGRTNLRRSVHRSRNGNDVRVHRIRNRIELLVLVVVNAAPIIIRRAGAGGVVVEDLGRSTGRRSVDRLAIVVAVVGWRRAARRRMEPSHRPWCTPSAGFREPCRLTPRPHRARDRRRPTSRQRWCRTPDRPVRAPGAHFEGRLSRALRKLRRVTASTS